MCEASSCLQLEWLIGRRDRMVFGKIKLKAPYEKKRIDIDEESLTVDMLVFTFDFDSNATLPGYLRYA